jgi:predicted permease
LVIGHFIMDYRTILAATIPVYLTMLVGAVVRRVGWLPREADAGIMSLAVKLLTPCLVFERIVGNPALNDAGQVLLNGALGYALVAGSMLLCHALSPVIGLKRGEGSRTFALSTGLQNYGYVAIPVVEALYDDKLLVGVMFTFTIGVELAMWTVGVGLLTGFGKAPWRLALNVPVIAILVSLALHYLGAGPHVPAIVHTVTGQLGACAIPLSVVLIGASIYDLIGTERIRWNVAVAAPVLRMAVLPLGFIAAGMMLPVTMDMKKILCVQAAMPAAVFSVVVARHYGGHAATAVLVIVSTTLVSLFSAPLVIGLAMKWLGAGG